MKINKTLLKGIIIILTLGFNLNSNAQEGTLLSKFTSGFYYDKNDERHEGLIKYIIITSENVEKIKAFKFKESEEGDVTKYNTKTSNGFGLDGSERIYHTVYKSEKSKLKNKGGQFARVYIGGESVTETTSIYYPLSTPITYLTKNKVQYLSTFVIRSGGNSKDAKVSFLFSKHKRVLKKYFKECDTFSMELAKDKKFLSVSNLENVVSVINHNCK